MKIYSTQLMVYSFAKISAGGRHLHLALLRKILLLVLLLLLYKELVVNQQILAARNITEHELFRTICWWRVREVTPLITTGGDRHYGVIYTRAI
jgi:hypothetical protein